MTDVKNVSLLIAHQLGTLPASEWQGVIALIPLSEGSGIDCHNTVLYEGLSTDQLVVTGVVHNINDAGLAGGSCRVNSMDYGESLNSELE